MKINFISDLHLEFGPMEIELGGGDILVLAGDIDIKGRVDWINDIAGRFNHVIYVLGNHEFYHGAMNNVYKETRESLVDNVHLLENESIIIDDVTLGNNYDMLYLMTLDEIDEIYFNKNGDGYGTRGGGGVITIYRKKGAVYGKMDKLYANQLVVKDGFSTEKKFYIPEFYALSKSDYLNYGSISWKSNISTDLSGNASFNVRNNNIDKAILIIQGFSIDGKLISEFKEINLLY